MQTHHDIGSISSRDDGNANQFLDPIHLVQQAREHALVGRHTPSFRIRSRGTKCIDLVLSQLLSATVI